MNEVMSFRTDGVEVGTAPSGALETALSLSAVDVMSWKTPRESESCNTVSRIVFDNELEIAPLLQGLRLGFRV